MHRDRRHVRILEDDPDTAVADDAAVEPADKIMRELVVAQFVHERVGWPRRLERERFDLQYRGNVVRDHRGDIEPAWRVGRGAQIGLHAGPRSITAGSSP